MENRAKEKDHHRSKIKTLTLRLTTENKNFFETWAQSHGFGFKKLASAFDYALDQLRMQDFQPEERIVEIEVCPNHSIIIDHPELVKCLEKGRGRNVSKDYCMLCSQHKKLNLPMTTIPRLEAKMTALETRCNYWKAQEEVAKNKALEMDEKTERGYQNRIQELEKNWKLTQDTLRERRQERDWHPTVKQSPAIEVDNNFHSVEERSQAIPNLSVVVERITEKENEKTKITEKFGQPQQAQQPKTQSSQLVLCPKTLDMRSVDVCNKCDRVEHCPQHGEYIVVERALGKR